MTTLNAIKSMAYRGVSVLARLQYLWIVLLVVGLGVLLGTSLGSIERGELTASIVVVFAVLALSLYKPLVAMMAWIFFEPFLETYVKIPLGAGIPDLSFQRLVGYVFQPIMFLIGVPWNEANAAGGLFGTKLVLNEFVAFIDLGQMGPEVLNERSRAIVTFALCGFANFSSIAIQMAVTGGLAPNQRPVIAKLGIRALLAGSLANLLSAALASLMLP